MTLAARIARILSPPWRLALCGELGSGKTVFVRGLARALQCRDEIASPTFALIHIYAGANPLVHCDWFRLDRALELDAIGWDELLDTSDRVVIEWADKFPSRLPPDARWLHLAYAPVGRTITLGSNW